MSQLLDEEDSIFLDTDLKESVPSNFHTSIPFEIWWEISAYLTYQEIIYLIHSSGVFYKLFRKDYTRFDFSSLPYFPKTLHHFTLCNEKLFEDIGEFVRENLSEDAILKFSPPHHTKLCCYDKNAYQEKNRNFELSTGVGENTGTGVYFAGSYALHQLLTLLKEKGSKTPFFLTGNGYFKPVGFVGNEWQSNDVDIFHVGCKKRGRHKMGPVDLVYSTQKTIEDVLLSFDMPCCRVAIDMHQNFYVSIKCLYSIYKKGEMYFPNKFEGVKNGWPNELACKAISRFEERYVKYKDRGFKFNFSRNMMARWMDRQWIPLYHDDGIEELCDDAGQTMSVKSLCEFQDDEIGKLKPREQFDSSENYEESSEEDSDTELIFPSSDSEEI